MARRTDSDWRELIAEQEKSRLPVAVFCQERGVNAKYFYLRRKRLSRLAHSAFVPVEVSPTAAVDDVISLECRGISLTLPSTLSSVWLADLVRHLTQ